VEDSGYRYVQIHEKGSDFCMLTCDLGKQAYTVDTYKFLIGVNDKKTSNQIDGRPVTMHKDENQGLSGIVSILSIERNMLAPISLYKSALLLYVYFHFFIRSVKKNTFFYLV
tara:strand:- start:25008 stop:25343 length:336 start_codon:yes stop_codon:yes gene_type:complete